MKLDRLNRHLLQQAQNNTTSVLREIKQKPLKGKDLQFMQSLEEVVQRLELLTLEVTPGK